MQSIILASKSPRRQELIRNITDDFEVIVSEADERLPEGISPEASPVYLAEVKARAVAEQHPDRLVIGADTVVILDGSVLGEIGSGYLISLVLEIHAEHLADVGIVVDDKNLGSHCFPFLYRLQRIVNVKF